MSTLESKLCNKYRHFLNCKIFVNLYTIFCINQTFVSSFKIVSLGFYIFIKRKKISLPRIYFHLEINEYMKKKDYMKDINERNK